VDLGCGTGQLGLWPIMRGGTLPSSSGPVQRHALTRPACLQRAVIERELDDRLRHTYIPALRVAVLQSASGAVTISHPCTDTTRTVPPGAAIPSAPPRRGIAVITTASATFAAPDANVERCSHLRPAGSPRGRGAGASRGPLQSGWRWSNTSWARCCRLSMPSIMLIRGGCLAAGWGRPSAPGQRSPACVWLWSGLDLVGDRGPRCALRPIPE